MNDDQHYQMQKPRRDCSRHLLKWLKLHWHMYIGLTLHSIDVHAEQVEVPYIAGEIKKWGNHLD